MKIPERYLLKINSDRAQAAQRGAAASPLKEAEGRQNELNKAVEPHKSSMTARLKDKGIVTKAHQRRPRA